MRLVVPVLVLAVAGCHVGPTLSGSGNVVSKDLPVGEFKKVELAGSGDLTLVAGDAPGLTVEVDDNLVEWLDCRADGETLHLGWKPNTNIRTTKTPKFQVRYTELSAVSLSGSGTIKADKLSADKLTIGVSGSGQTTLSDLKVGTLTFKLSGSGTLTATGTADAFEATISGSGDVAAKELKAKRVKVSIAGSGDAKVWATDKLDASVSGSGTVTYKGNPADVSTGGSGSGKVRKGE